MFTSDIVMYQQSIYFAKNHQETYFCQISHILIIIWDKHFLLNDSIKSNVKSFDINDHDNIIEII